MLLEPIYEQDFYDCSFGYRPGRSAHQALQAIRQAIMGQSGRWVLDIDVCKYFDSIDHAKLRGFLAKRVTDGVVRRLLDKGLKAGVLEAGQVVYPETGTPQGGVVSPLLSNIFLHYGLDEWFVETVQPRLKGRSTLVRFCDDFVMVVEYRDEVLRVQNVLSKRLERFGLQLHPDKARRVDFGNHRPEMQGGSLSLPGTFNFLGFIHFWGKSRKGNWVVRQWMAKERLARALKSLRAQCWQMMHWPLRAQHARLCLQIRGDYAYFGITDNGRRLQRLRYLAERTWRRALARRTRDHCLTWETFARILRRFPLPRPRIVHGYTAL